MQQLAPLKKRLAELESSIAFLEESIAARESEMADKAFFEQGQATAEKVREYESWKSGLAANMEEWESVAEQIQLQEAED